MGFLDGITEIKSNADSGGAYMKFQPGANQFRIVGSGDDGGFIQGMLGWSEDTEGKRHPHRWKIGADTPMDITFKDRPKEFYAMLVWNYKESKIQILELTQSGLKAELMALANDTEDWGDPRKFDITITKSGEKLDTRYAMTPKPPKKRSDEINDAVKAKKVNLSALFDGGDPFGDTPAPAPAPKPTPAPEPAKEESADQEEPF
jgi:hypothetical protein